MTADPAAVHPAAHPLYALTTYELTGYRRELEHALAVLPGHAPGREDLRRRLADVTGEQESRATIAASPGAPA